MIDIEPQVISRAQAGDQEACRSIINSLHRPVLATIYRFLGRRFQADMEDIAQDIFLKLFRSIERFDLTRGVKFTTWTFTFVRNHCFDILKKRRLHTTSLTYLDGEEKQREVPDPSMRPPSLNLENSELGEKIEEALGRLGEEQRMVFVLREYEGLDYNAIAQVMGVSEGTVKSRLHRAKQALRERLAPYMKTGA